MWNGSAVMAHKDETRSAGCVPVVELIGDDRNGAFITLPEGFDGVDRVGYLPREIVAGKLTLGYAKSLGQRLDDLGIDTLVVEAGGAAPPIITKRNEVESDDPERIKRAAQINNLISAKVQITDSIRAIERELGIIRDAASLVNWVCRSLTAEAL